MADVFISYAHEDEEFVRKLRDRLEERKRKAWIDDYDIPPLAEEWLEEVHAGIESADTFAFVISEDSVNSRWCKAELSHAVKNNKRLAPILHREVDDDEAVPTDLRKHQWIKFRQTDDFEEAFQKLVRALDMDLEWVQAHTRLLTRAREWEKTGRDSSLLLRGKELNAAEALQAQERERGATAFATFVALAASGLLYTTPITVQQNLVFGALKEPKLTDLQKDYIRDSRRAATRFKQVMLGAVAFVLIVVGLAALAFWQRYEANLQRDRANLQRVLTAQAQLLSGQGGKSLQTSVLFAAEAKQRLPFSLAADEILRRGVALLADPGPELLHQAPLYAVAYSPDGKYVATAGDDGAHLWDAKSGEEVAPPLESDLGVSNVIFSPDAKYVATASADGTARVWGVPSGKQIAPPMKHDGAVLDVAFSPDVKLLATTDSTKEAAYVWNVADGKRHPRLFDLPGPGNRVAFGPGGKYLATASWPTEDSGNVAQVWDLDKRREIASVKHEDVISRLTFSPDGKYLATASADGTARVWDAKSGKEISRVQHDGGLTDLAFGPDGNRLGTASFDATARVWDVKSGEQITRFEHDSTVNDVALSRDGKQLATVSLDTAHVWDIATGQEVARMSHLDKVARVAFSPDGKHVVTASYDHTARIWDVSGSGVTGVAHDEGSVRGVNYSPDGRYLATAGGDNTARVWDVESGDEIHNLEHHDVVNGVTFSPDSKFLATASSDNTARVWEVSTGKQKVLMPHFAGVYGGITFSPDGKYLASASADGIAHVWDAESGKEIQSFQHTTSGGAYSAYFSPDGKRLATAGADGKALVWDIATGKAVGQVSPQMTHDREIWDVAFSPNGKYLALAGMDGTVWLWDLASKNIEGEPMRHQGPVAALNFSSDGKYLATVSYDHTARVWEVPGTKEIARLDHEDSLNGVAFSPDGDRLATAGADGIARIEPWRPEGLVGEACSRLTHNLTEGEWQLYVGGPYEETCPDLPVPPGRTVAPPVRVENGGPTNSRLSGGEEQAGLESIRTSHTAAEAEDACGNTITYEPENAVDGSPTTAWKVGGTGVEEWIELKYDKPIEVSRVGIIPGYDKIDPCDGTDRFNQYYVIKRARIELSDGSSVEKTFQKEPQMQFVDVPDAETSSVRVTVLETYPPANNLAAAPYSYTVGAAAISEIDVG